MEILQGNVLGPKLHRLLQQYIDGQKVVLKAGKFHGSLFVTGRGVTQGYLVSPTIFNIVVDAVVRADLLEVYGPQEDSHGFGWRRYSTTSIFTLMMDG